MFESVVRNVNVGCADANTANRTDAHAYLRLFHRIRDILVLIFIEIAIAIAYNLFANMYTPLGTPNIVVKQFEVLIARMRAWRGVAGSKR